MEVKILKEQQVHVMTKYPDVVLGGDWERKEVEKVQREKRKKRGAEGRRNWTRGKRKMAWEGGGVGARPGVGSRVLSRGQQSLHQ